MIPLVAGVRRSGHGQNRLGYPLARAPGCQIRRRVLKGLVNDSTQLTTEVKWNADLLQEIRRQLTILTPEGEGPA